MGKDTGIEWAHDSWAPWFGCSKISRGCQNCYADTLVSKRFKLAEWGPLGVRKRSAPSTWRLPVTWHRQALAQGQRRRLFCGHLCDVFENKRKAQPGENLPQWRRELVALIDQCHALDWLILTKRPHNVMAMLAEATEGDPAAWLKARPWVWLGTSIEDQATAAQRLPALAAIPAHVRFVSAEPLLEPINLLTWLGHVDWVIVGGESGTNARPCHVEWIRNVAQQCRARGVPVFVKQLGDRAMANGVPYRAGPKGKALHLWPPDLRVQQVPQSLPWPAAPQAQPDVPQRA